MDFDRADRQAYEAANDAVLSSVDVLLAVWDGQPGTGSGGTAEGTASRTYRAMSQRVPTTTTLMCTWTTTKLPSQRAHQRWPRSRATRADQRAPRPAALDCSGELGVSSRGRTDTRPPWRGRRRRWSSRSRASACLCEPHLLVGGPPPYLDGGGLSCRVGPSLASRGLGRRLGFRQASGRRC
jgi:hypothetical protein